MTEKAKITVEVGYARLDEQALLEVKLDEGATVRDAIEASQICLKFTEIDLETQKIGIFGKKTTLDTVLNDWDRVEIYRPLIADPKAAAKKKAAAATA
jgi:putative ubiquitin-RnfH superfamily antitoxin RatB of RatAB toxin-antitoxin module